MTSNPDASAGTDAMASRIDFFVATSYFFAGSKRSFRVVVMTSLDSAGSSDCLATAAFTDVANDWRADMAEIFSASLWVDLSTTSSELATSAWTDEERTPMGTTAAETAAETTSDWPASELNIDELRAPAGR